LDEHYTDDEQSKKITEGERAAGGHERGGVKAALKRYRTKISEKWAKKKQDEEEKGGSKEGRGENQGGKESVDVGGEFLPKVTKKKRTLGTVGKIRGHTENRTGGRWSSCNKHV